VCFEGVLDQDATLRRWQIVWQYLRKKSQSWMNMSRSWICISRFVRCYYSFWIAVSM